MPVNTIAKIASVVTEPVPCTAVGGMQSTATTASCAVGERRLRDAVHVRADGHDVEGEQHRAREREQIAAPEREVGTGEEIEADHREADADAHGSRGQPSVHARDDHRHEHDVEARDERRRRRRRVLQPDGLRRVPGEQQRAGERTGAEHEPSSSRHRRARYARTANGATHTVATVKRPTRYANGVMSSSASRTSGNVMP